MCGEQLPPSCLRTRRSGSPPRVRGTGFPVGEGLAHEGITPACAGNRPATRSATCSTTDHPRVCGEQCSMLAAKLCALGSPPRVRGTVRKAKRAILVTRITPACAGNRELFRSGCKAYWDHPRVCGEQFPRPGVVQVGKGSPPRVRGTALAREETASVGGITPACAGNRKGNGCMACARKDHPRVCGEQT